MKNSLAISLKTVFSVLLISSFSCKQSQKQKETELKQLYSENYIKANGIKLHYLDWGGSGQPLVLIHSLGETPFLFQELASALKKKLQDHCLFKTGTLQD